MKMNPKEAEYYSQKRCETCAFMCKNPRLNRIIVMGTPWVCGCEETSAFNKQVKADSHTNCKYWQQRDLEVWLRQYEYMIRQVKDPGEKWYTDRSKYRNIFTFAPVVKKYIDDLKNEPNVMGFASLRYGLSENLIKRMLEYLKEVENE